MSFIPTFRESHLTGPEFACGEIVYIRPNIYMKDDKRDFIVMSNSLGCFGGWQAWIVPVDDHYGKHESVPEGYLTRKNPYVPDYQIAGHRMTSTGRTLLVINGDQP